MKHNLPENFRTIVPLTTATNSYELLEDILRRVAEEPKRLWMEVIVGRFDDILNRSHFDRPACGTVGCLLGWGKLLTGRQDMISTQHTLFPGDTGDPVYVATCRLFSTFPNRKLFNTPESYAECIRLLTLQFMCSHEKELRAHTITVKADA